MGQFDEKDVGLKVKELGDIIKHRVPEFKIKRKQDSFWHRLLGRLLFFNRKYMTDYTTTLGYTVWFPSKKLDSDSLFRILAHEYVHLLDYKNNPIWFLSCYGVPLYMSVFSLLALLAIWFSNWWLISLIFLLFLLPIPSLPRAVLEMRGYAMNLAIKMWYGKEIDNEDRKELKDIFSGWSYYKMWTNDKDIDDWIDETIKLVRGIDKVKSIHNIFDESVAYEDVYSLVTGIEFDDNDDE